MKKFSKVMKLCAVVNPFLFCTCPALFCPCLVACELHADRETETVGGRVNGGGRLACIEKKGGGRLPATWALTLTRPKTGGVGTYPGVGPYAGYYGISLLQLESKFPCRCT